MKRIRAKPRSPQFPEDTARIVRVMAERGLECSSEDAVLMWERYSDEEFCAGWMTLPDDDDGVFQALHAYFEVAPSRPRERMTRRRLARLAELCGVIEKALDGGGGFAWGDGEGAAHVRTLRDAGIELVTKTEAARRGHRLKRGTAPVGSRYYPAPIQRSAPLYVLHVQTTPYKHPETGELPGIAEERS